MEGRLLARARARQEEIRIRNRAEEARRREEVYARVPEIRRLDGAIRGLMLELVGLAMGQPGRPGEELERESLALQARREALLREDGWPGEYLDSLYRCPVCRDTGWAGGEICACLEALYKQEQTRDLAPLLRQGDETFETFRLDYYGPAASAGEPGSPRRQMERIYSTCRLYAESFGPESPNLLFTGGPGLGKTFLSAAIARVTAEAGFSVAYDTASGLLACFEREKFSRDEDGQADAASRVRQLLSCDLLILDDLGTEMLTAFTQSALYSLIDSRLRGGKKTVISTNLDREGIESRYGPQLASRLCGEYQWLEFQGRDIRAIRKENT